VDREFADWPEGTGVAPVIWLTAQAFHCQVCGLHLDSQAEIYLCFDPDAEPVTDARNIEPEDDAGYEHWRRDMHKP
jgi:hypothetical protein